MRHSLLLAAAVASVVGAMNIGAQVSVAPPPTPSPANQSAPNMSEPTTGDRISMHDGCGGPYVTYELGTRKTIRKVDSINLIRMRADGKGLTKDTKYIAYTELLAKIADGTVIRAAVAVTV